MIDLVFQDYHPNYKRCGCYIRSEEFVKLYPKKHVLPPLRSCSYQVDLVNSIASVSLIQSYQNPTDKFLQMEYNFPINPNACVYKFTADFGKVRIEGIVKEKEQARKEYQEAVKEGKRAALGEINNESKDIMTLKVGNVGPAEYVKIQIAYLQELGLSNNTFYQFHLPGTISPRYMNHVPNEALVKGFRKPGQVSAEGTFTWNFKINLQTTRKVVFFDSSSHDITLLSQNDTQTLSQFAMTQATVPNKDFVFTYTTEEFQLPSYVYGSTDVSSSAMLSFIPKFCSLDLDDAYKASVKGTAFEADIETAKGEYVFLLDRSGSMGGKRIEKAKEALILFIKSLPQDTYFNVVSFGSGSTKLFPNSVKYDDKQVKRAVDEIKKMSADMGGTEIYHPLKSLLQSKPIAEGYPKQVFLLTDGGVSNTEGVIHMVGQNSKYARVHTIAVGNGASEALILGCAKSGKGYHVFITDDENPSDKIIQLLTDSLSPVISNIKLKYDKNVVQSIIPNPDSLPYILKGELVNFYINFKGQLQEPTAMSFSYEDSVTKLPYTAEIHVQPEPNSLPFVDKMGQFRKIRLMEQSFTNNSQLEDYMFYVKVVDKKAQIVKESVRHQILSEFTAFVCVEQELIDGKYSQIKNTGQISVLVENPRPIEYEEEYERKMESMTLSMNRSKKAALSNMAMRSAPRAMEEATAPPVMRQMAMRSAPRRQMLKCAAMPRSSNVEKKSSGFGQFFGNITSSIASVFSSSSKQSEKKEQRMQMCMPAFEASSAPVKNYQVAEEKSMMKRKQQLQMMMNECCNIKEEAQDLDMDIPQVEQKKEKEKAKEKKSEPIKITNFSIETIVGLQSTEGSWKDISLLASLYSPEVKERVASGEHLIAVLTYLVAKWIEKNHPQKQYSLLIKKALNFVKKEIPNHEQFLKAYQTILP